MRIAVCRPQQPFVRGGAEIFADKLVSELQARGHEADIVSVPFPTWPNPRLLSSALMWRFVDLRPGGSSAVDLVIATKFPSYLIEHPNKVVWLLHQLRQAYELDGTEFGQFGPSPFDRAIRDRIEAADRFALGRARRVFATSSNVAARLKRSTGIDAEVLPHPPQELDYRCDGYGSFVLSVGRLDPLKRIDLLLQAAALEPRLEAVVAGDGPDRARLEELSSELGVDGRVRFAGRISEAELTDLYAGCRAVYYAPVDEDFGDGAARGVPLAEAGSDDDRCRRAARLRPRVARPGGWSSRTRRRLRPRSARCWTATRSSGATVRRAGRRLRRSRGTAAISRLLGE